MKKVLFTHSYFLRFDSKQWESGRPYPPLGTVYAATLLKSEGYNISLWDSMFSKDPEDIKEILEKEKPGILVIYDDGFNYLTKMCLTNMRNAAFRMIQIAKGLGIQVIVSSSDSTDRYAEYLMKGADFILHGEGEQTLLELIQTLEQGKTDFSGIRGISFCRESIIKNPPRDVLKALDSLPIPDWSLISLERYAQLWKKSAGYFSMNMSTTRGCPFKCNWCAKPIYGNRYNSRSPENVVKEINYLIANFGIDHIWFCDDIFGLKPGWVGEFVHCVERENLSFRFKIQSRADLLVDEKLVEGLARIGCDEIWIGAESGSQKILDAMDKGITLEQIHKSTDLMKKNGIKPCFFIQFGYLDETKTDIDSTVELITTLMPEQIGISVSYPLPGTVFYEKVKNELVTKTNWTDSNEMALLFRNTYSPKFYKELYQYVHYHYRKHKAKSFLAECIDKPFQVNRKKIIRAISYFYFSPLSHWKKLKLDKLEKALA